jgi:hypothetical protein
MVALGVTTVVTEMIVDGIAEVTVVMTVDGTAVVTVVTDVAVTTTVSVPIDAGGAGNPATASAGFSIRVSIIRADRRSTATIPMPKIAVATTGRGRHLFVTSGECKSLGTSPLLVELDSGTRFEMVSA